MKFSKILFLIPALAIVACSSDPVNYSSSGEEPTRYEVSKETWEKNLGDDCTMFGPDINAHFETDIDGVHGAHTIRMDLDNGKYHTELLDEGTGGEGYSAIVPGSYNEETKTYLFDFYDKHDGVWEVSQETSTLFAIARGLFPEYYGLEKMEAFEYDESNKAYICEDYSQASSQKYVVKRAVVKFENDHIVFLKFHIEHNTTPDYYWDIEMRVTNYGNVTVTLPKVN